jgi:hypothetical protein
MTNPEGIAFTPHGDVLPYAPGSSHFAGEAARL